MSEIILHHNDIFFENPKRLVHPECWIEFIPVAFKIMEYSRPKSLVELGAHSGNSFCAFNQAAQFLGLETKCYAIDTWKGDFQAGFYDTSIYEDLYEYCCQEYPQSAKLIRSTFDEANTFFENNTIDLLHFDGLHTYEAIKHDFFTWLPKLSLTGIILVHDICVMSEGFGVYQFWNEIKAHYDFAEFNYGNGLGILFIGNRIDQIQKSKILSISIESVWKDLLEMKGQYILLQKRNEKLDLALSHTSGILENYKASNSFKIGKRLLFPIRFLLSLIKRQRS